MMPRPENVDAYIERAEHWGAELAVLREILLSMGLEETIKWGQPCYTFEGRNVVGLGGFASYFGLWFFQGALLTDPEEVLVNAQPGKTQALRQWRFTSKKDIRRRTVKAYVQEAMALPRAQRAAKPRAEAESAVPVELARALARDARARAAFDAMSASCRREYADHVAEAKREETRLRRVEKILPMIRDGGGLNDRYRRR